MAKKYASDYARDIGAQIQGNVSQVIALKQKARAEEAEAKRYAEQQARLDRQEAAALRKEARQIEIDKLNRENLEFERQFKISAEERAVKADERADRAADRADEQFEFQKDEAEDRKTQKYLQRRGVDKIATSVLDPSIIDARDSQAMDLAWKEYEAAGANLEANVGDPAAEARWAQAQRQWTQVSGVSEGRSKRNQETFQGVQTGGFDNLSTDITTEQERWANYNLTPKLDENGEVVRDANGEPVMVEPSFFMQEGVLMVGEEGSANAVPWTDSRYADASDVYTPLLVAKETAFNSTDYANTVAEETFDPSKMRAFTVLDEETKLGTGELDIEAFDGAMTDRARTDFNQNVHLRNQIALEQYNEDTPGKDYLDSDDQRKALEKYNPEAANVKFGNDQTPAIYGEYKNGEWEFAVTDADIEDSNLTREEKDAVKEYRKAYKNYADKESANVQSKIIPIDERPQIESERQRREELEQRRRDAQNAATTSTSSGPTAPTFTALTTTPSTTAPDGSTVAGVPTFNFPGNETVTIPGTEFGFSKVAVQGVELDPATGEVAAYTLTVPNDIMTAAMNQAGADPDARAQVQNLFDDAVSTKITPDNPLFASISNDMRNTTSGSSRRPGPQARIEQAQNEISIFNYFAEQGMLGMYGVDSIDELTPETMRQMAEDYEAAGQ
jgi:hypothetical protein